MIQFADDNELPREDPAPRDSQSTAGQFSAPDDALVVTIAQFNLVYEAHLAAGKLEHEGVECFVAERDAMGMKAYYGLADGADLRVARPDAERAAKILSTTPASKKLTFNAKTGAAAQSNEPMCPLCGSLRVRPPRVRRLPLLLRKLLRSLGMAHPTQWRCADCGHHWSTRKDIASRS